MNLEKELKHPVFSIIRQVAGKEKSQTFIVGGFVRDLLLHRPCSDVDCVVIGDGIKLSRAICQEIGKQTGHRPELLEFAQFGTCKFHYKDMEMEFVGARKETYLPSSRKPVVETGTLEEDQMRRDFSINAMAISLNDGSFGLVSDPFNGLEDLEHQTIRVHRDADVSFSEDPLRMFRAIRFASQLFFDIEPQTFDAIVRNAGRCRILSAERITEELNKILLSPKPSYGFKLLDAAGLLPIFFPELTALKGVEVRNGKAHKDNFEHTLEVLDHVAFAGGDLWLRWAALLHDIAKPRTKKFEEPRGWTFHGHEFAGGKMVPGIFRRFKLPMDENMRFVKKLVELHLRPIILAEDIVTDSAVRRLLFEAGEDIDKLMTLAKADITSKNHEKVVRYRNNFTIVEKKLKELEEKDRIRNFQPPVSGTDIMEYFGIAPCAEIGIVKTRIKDAVLDGLIGNNREEAWAMMLRIGEELGLKAASGATEKTQKKDAGPTENEAKATSGNSPEEKKPAAAPRPKRKRIVRKPPQHGGL